MKKRSILLTVIMAVAMFTLSFREGYTQESSTRQERQQKREAANQQAFEQLKATMASGAFSFTPSRIISVLNPNLAGVSISPFYGVWVTPYLFKAFLPVFGPDPYTGQATLLRTMDFNNQTYDYSYEEEDKAFKATIKVTDNRAATTYTFVFNVDFNQNFSTMSITTAFSSSIVFQGTLVPYGN